MSLLFPGVLKKGKKNLYTQTVERTTRLARGVKVLPKEKWLRFFSLDDLIAALLEPSRLIPGVPQPAAMVDRFMVALLALLGREGSDDEVRYLDVERKTRERGARIECHFAELPMDRLYSSLKPFILLFFPRSRNRDVR